MLRRLICRLEAIGIKGQRADLTALSALGISTLQNPDGALPPSSRNMYLLPLPYDLCRLGLVRWNDCNFSLMLELLKRANSLLHAPARDAPLSPTSFAPLLDIPDENIITEILCQAFSGNWNEVQILNAVREKVGRGKEDQEPHADAAES